LPRVKADKAIALVFLIAFGCEKGPPDLSKPADPAKTPGSVATAATNAPPEKPQIPAPPDVAAPPADAKKEASGLASKVLQPGTGADHPSADSKVKVHYTGWTTDGKMFDSSVQRGQPITFPLNGVIPGWTEGVQLMVVGEKRRFWIPEEMAYKGKPGRPQGMLVFDVELLDIKKPIAAPSDVAAIPADAKKEKSGLASRVLTKGKGTAHPAPKDEVEVHYTGWTTDGKMFDSSVERGEPAKFQLDMVIPGWTEGVQLMTEGEKRRLWIPQDLAYKGQPGAPAGMLVFDVELLKITKSAAPAASGASSVSPSASAPAKPAASASAAK
jgi:FKBP-type peptidyl-prolyl cis-trans isomerase